MNEQLLGIADDFNLRHNHDVIIKFVAHTIIGAKRTLSIPPVLYIDLSNTQSCKHNLPPLPQLLYRLRRAIPSGLVPEKRPIC